MAKAPLKPAAVLFAQDPATGAYIDKATGAEIPQDERAPAYAAVKAYLAQGGTIEALPPPPPPIRQRDLVIRLHKLGISEDAVIAALSKADPLLAIDWRHPESDDFQPFGAIAKVILSEFGLTVDALWG